MKTRAERRHHHRRMIDRVKNFAWIKSWFGTEESREEHIKRVAENRKACSCDMCRNPRHSSFYKGRGKLTMQEKKALQEKDEDVQL